MTEFSTDARWQFDLHHWDETCCTYGCYHEWWFTGNYDANDESLFQEEEPK